jgi:hypothetical protein
MTPSPRPSPRDRGEGDFTPSPRDFTAWTRAELDTIGGAEEIELAPRRSDGSLRDPVTVWVVRNGDGIYVRSAVKGRNAAWYRTVTETRGGRLSAGSMAKDVGFVDADPALNDEVDAAYRSKYRRYAGRILNSCLTPEARSTTLRIDPR